MTSNPPVRSIAEVEALLMKAKRDAVTREVELRMEVKQISRRREAESSGYARTLANMQLTLATSQHMNDSLLSTIMEMKEELAQAAAASQSVRRTETQKDREIQRLRLKVNEARAQRKKGEERYRDAINNVIREIEWRKLDLDKTAEEYETEMAKVQGSVNEHAIKLQEAQRTIEALMLERSESLASHAAEVKLLKEDAARASLGKDGDSSRVAHFASRVLHQHFKEFVEEHYGAAKALFMESSRNVAEQNAIQTGERLLESHAAIASLDDNIAVLKRKLAVSNENLRRAQLFIPGQKCLAQNVLHTGQNNQRLVLSNNMAAAAQHRAAAAVAAAVSPAVSAGEQAALCDLMDVSDVEYL